MADHAVRLQQHQLSHKHSVCPKVGYTDVLSDVQCQKVETITFAQESKGHRLPLDYRGYEDLWLRLLLHRLG